MTLRTDQSLTSRVGRAVRETLTTRTGTRTGPGTPEEREVFREVLRERRRLQQAGQAQGPRLATEEEVGQAALQVQQRQQAPLTFATPQQSAQIAAAHQQLGMDDINRIMGQPTDKQVEAGLQFQQNPTIPPEVPGAAALQDQWNTLAPEQQQLLAPAYAQTVADAQDEDIQELNRRKQNVRSWTEPFGRAANLLFRGLDFTPGLIERPLAALMRRLPNRGDLSYWGLQPETDRIKYVSQEVEAIRDPQEKARRVKAELMTDRILFSTIFGRDPQHRRKVVEDMLSRPESEWEDILHKHEDPLREGLGRTLVDPFTYLGYGMLVKAARHVPVLGQLAKVIPTTADRVAQYQRLFIEPAREAATTAELFGRGRLNRTIVNRSGEMAREYSRTVLAPAKSVDEATLVLGAWKRGHAVAGPDIRSGVSHLSRAGRWLADHISDETVEEIGKLSDRFADSNELQEAVAHRITQDIQKNVEAALPAARGLGAVAERVSGAERVQKRVLGAAFLGYNIGFNIRNAANNIGMAVANRTFGLMRPSAADDFVKRAIRIKPGRYGQGWGAAQIARGERTTAEKVISPLTGVGQNIEADMNKIAHVQAYKRWWKHFARSGNTVPTLKDKVPRLRGLGDELESIAANAYSPENADEQIRLALDSWANGRVNPSVAAYKARLGELGDFIPDDVATRLTDALQEGYAPFREALTEAADDLARARAEMSAVSVRQAMRETANEAVAEALERGDPLSLGKIVNSLQGSWDEMVQSELRTIELISDSKLAKAASQADKDVLFAERRAMIEGTLEKHLEQRLGLVDDLIEDFGEALSVDLSGLTKTVQKSIRRGHEVMRAGFREADELMDQRVRQWLARPTGERGPLINAYRVEKGRIIRAALAEAREAYAQATDAMFSGLGRGLRQVAEEAQRVRPSAMRIIDREVATTKSGLKMRLMGEDPSIGLMYDIQDQTGKIRASLSFKIEGDVATEVSMRSREGPGALGVRAVREVMRTLQDLHPQLKRIQGERVGGARFGGAAEFGTTRGPIMERALPIRELAEKMRRVGPKISKMAGQSDINLEALIDGLGIEPSLPAVQKWQTAQALEALGKLDEAVQADAILSGSRGILPEELDMIRQWQRSVFPALNDIRQGALRLAERDVSNAVLNYGDRTIMDPLLGLVFPYQFWYQRMYGVWWYKLMDEPAMLQVYARYRNAMTDERSNPDIPQRLRDLIPSPNVPFLPGWAGSKLMSDPLSLFIPFQSFLPFKEAFSPREADTEPPWARGFRLMESIGPGVSPAVGVAKTGLSILSGDETLQQQIKSTGSFTLPVEAPIRGIGLLLDPWFKKMGIDQPPAGWLPIGVVRRMLDQTYTPSYWEQNYWRYQHLAFLIAEGLDDIPEDQRDQFVIDTLNQGVRQRGELWDEATRRAAIHKAIPAASSFFLGLPMQIYPEGERLTRGLKALRDASYRAGLEDNFYSIYPEYAVRSSLWGDPDPVEGFKNGAERTIRYRQTAILDAQKFSELEQDIKGNFLGDHGHVYDKFKPRYDQVWQTNRDRPYFAGMEFEESLLRAVDEAAPKPEDFVRADGSIDWSLWRQAQENFRQGLPGKVMGHPMVEDAIRTWQSQIGGRKVTTLRPESLLTAEMWDQWRQRNHPLWVAIEHAARERVASGWDERNRVFGDFDQFLHETQGLSDLDRDKARLVRDQGLLHLDEQFPAIDGMDLVPILREMYPTRREWTDELLAKELRNFRIPGFEEMRENPISLEAQAEGIFWDYVDHLTEAGRKAAGQGSEAFAAIMRSGSRARRSLRPDIYMEALTDLRDMQQNAPEFFIPGALTDSKKADLVQGLERFQQETQAIEGGEGFAAPVIGAGEPQAAAGAAVAGTATWEDVPQGVRRWENDVTRIAEDRGIDPGLMAAVIQQESGGNPDVRGQAALEVGLMQVVPKEATRLGERFAWASARPTSAQLADPQFNMRTGGDILASALGSARGNIRLALAIYNAGLGGAQRGLGFDYADAVLGHYQRFFGARP